jgi:hypothetical protein
MEDPAAWLAWKQVLSSAAMPAGLGGKNGVGSMNSRTHHHHHTMRPVTGPWTWLGMKGVSTMAMAAAVLVAMLVAMTSTPVAGQPIACPLTARLSARPKVSRGLKPGVMAGDKVVIKVKVSKANRKAALGQGGVSISLPAGLCVLSTKPGRAQVVPVSGNVFWPQVNFNTTVAMPKFKVKARVQSTFNETSATFSANVYIPGRGCGSAASPVQVRGVCVWGGRGAQRDGAGVVDEGD